MDSALYANYLAILHHELVPALGCTEPIAIAYAAAKARQILGEFPDSVEMHLSGNIIKNVKGVTVPNSGGLKGIDIAALLGITGGNADKALEVLEGIRPEHIRQAQELAEKHICSCTLAEGVSNLYICAKVRKDSHYAEVTIVDQHTNITRIVKDGQVLFSGETTEKKQEEPPVDKSKLTVKDILDFADLRPVIIVQAFLGNCCI